MCGASKSGGGTCAKPPIAGFTRCLSHGGPIVARAVRARQLVALARGDLSHEAFERLERRRVVNRLRERWKKDPWSPGTTLDLGEQEDEFRDALRACGHVALSLAPAVLDHARWRYRRLMIDRSRPDDWRAYATSDLPERVRRAGPAPEDWHAEMNVASAVAAMFDVPARLSPTSKRRKLDPPRPAARKLKPRTRDRVLKCLGKNTIDALGRDVIDAVLIEHGHVIRHVAGDTATDELLVQVAAALGRVLRDPSDEEAAEHWRDLVFALSAPPTA